MTQPLPVFPEASTDDAEDVASALDAGAVLWGKGDRVEALRWLRRAREFADDAGIDRRALELARLAADLAAALSATPSSSTGNSNGSTIANATTEPVVEEHEPKRSKLPELPSPLRKFTHAVESLAQEKPASSAASTSGTSGYPPVIRSETKASSSAMPPPSPSQRAAATPLPIRSEPQRGSEVATRKASVAPHPRGTAASTTPIPVSNEPQRGSEVATRKASVAPHPRGTVANSTPIPLKNSSATSTPIVPSTAPHPSAATAASTPSVHPSRHRHVEITSKRQALAEPSASVKAHESNSTARDHSPAMLTSTKVQLLSIPVRIDAMDADGSLRFTPRTDGSTDAEEGHAILVITQELWESLKSAR